MKKSDLSSKKILAVLFCLVTVFFLGTIAERAFRYSVLGQAPDDTIAAETEEETGVSADSDDPLVRQFPFKDGSEPAGSTESDAGQSSAGQNEQSALYPVGKYMTKIKSNVPFYTEKLLFSRMNFINLNARYNKAIGMKILNDTNSIVISLLDGNLTLKPIKQEVTASAESVVEFAGKLKENNTEFLYVQAPSKVDPQNNLLPVGIEDYDNAAADEMIGILEENGVNCLDVRKLLHEQNIDYTEAFFKTDHHWTIDTAFWASGEIAKYIDNNTSVKIKTSKFDINSFSEEVYKGISLGSLGKAVTASYVDPEDFSVILPKYETDFRFYNFYDGSERNGSFEETLVNTDILQTKDLYNVSTYSSYMYTWSDLVSVENKTADNETSILVIGDSFRNSVVPFLSLGVKNVYSMAVSFPGSVDTFLEQYKPDMVIILIYPPVASVFKNGIR